MIISFRKPNQFQNSPHARNIEIRTNLSKALGGAFFFRESYSSWETYSGKCPPFNRIPMIKRGVFCLLTRTPQTGALDALKAGIFQRFTPFTVAWRGLENFSASQ